MIENNGCLVISLDFEMMWGCHDWASIDGYGKTNISHVREVIQRLIQLFDTYDIHATVATVGMLMFNDKNELLKSLPKNIPSYENTVMSPYKPGFLDSISEENEYLFFASDIIDSLKSKPGIEIGTHTFSHYYCWEKGQTLQQFDEDIKNAVEAANQRCLFLESIVFPKNNVSEDYLTVAAKYGIRTYRGNPKHFYNSPKNTLLSLWQRAMRLLDIYFPLVKNTYSYDVIESTTGVVNIGASRFLRPYNHNLRWFERFKVARIKKEMRYAARNHEVYHLWWHPHNFGNNLEENLKILEDILRNYSLCSKKYGMMSMSMSELADYVSTK